jgi:hypothetical protein
MPAVDLLIPAMSHETFKYSPPALALILRSLTAGTARKGELDGQGRKTINVFLYCVAVFLLLIANLMRIVHATLVSGGIVVIVVC